MNNRFFVNPINTTQKLFQSPERQAKLKVLAFRLLTSAIIVFVACTEDAMAQENNDFNSDFSSAAADGTYFKTMMDNAWTIIKGGTYVGGTALMANGFWKLKNAKDDWHSPVIGGGLMMALIPGIKFAKSLFSGTGITKLVDNN